VFLGQTLAKSSFIDSRAQNRYYTANPKNSMIAVISTGGKQYLVSEGDVIKIEKLETEAGKPVSFETLLTAEGDNLNLGTPTLGEKVTAEVIRHARHPKIEVVKYKAKSRYVRRNGHRQHFTEVKITKIA